MSERFYQFRLFRNLILVFNFFLKELSQVMWDLYDVRTLQIFKLLKTFLITTDEHKVEHKIIF